MSRSQLGQLASAPRGISTTICFICGQCAVDGLPHLPGAWLALSQDRGVIATCHSSPSRLAQAHLCTACSQVPKSSSRGKPSAHTLLNPPLSYIMFANVPLAKVTRSSLDVRVGETDFTSCWEKTQSHTAKGCGCRKGTNMLPFLRTLPQNRGATGKQQDPFPSLTQERQK